MDRNTITSADLRAKLAAEFGGQGGGARLARALGVSASTASMLRRGNPAMTLVKVGAYYGYEPAGDDAWTRAPVKRDPRDVGYRHRWTQLVLDDLRALMSLPKSQRPRTSDVAKRFGVSQATLRGVMAKAHITLRKQGDRP